MGRKKLEEPSPKCSAPKCRRVARIDGLCKKCHEQGVGAAPQAPANGGNGTTVHPAADIPGEVVHDMLPAEAEQWGRLQAEVVSKKQAAQLLALQQRELQRQHDDRMADLERKRRGQLAAAQEVQGIYEQVTAELCARYGTDRQYTVIDVEGRIIREERPGT